MKYGPRLGRPGNIRVLVYGLSTSFSCSGWVARHDLHSLLFSACSSASSNRFWRVSFRAICYFLPVVRANCGASAVLPTRVIPRTVSTWSRGCRPNSKINSVSCISILKLVLRVNLTKGKSGAQLR